MKYSWSKTVFPIAAIFSFRMLGLFLLIPVFTVYAAQLKGATPKLIGFALGGYGLTQGLLQIPFGMLSDRFGRKPIITLGLILFTIGSIIGALSDSIYGVILARILQGTGAIGSVLIALLADVTSEKERTKAMAVIGMSIGMSFSLAMVISPAITRHYGLEGIFYLTTGLALLGIALLHGVIPNSPFDSTQSKANVDMRLFRAALSNIQLQRLNLGIFCQHFILTATFFVIPLILKTQVQLGHLTEQWHFYLPLMIGSFVLMLPFIIIGEAKKKGKTVFLLAISATGLAQCLLAFSYQAWHSLCGLMFVYFIAFNILEASLPSQISKQAPANSKGTAMGIYSTAQFLGIFAGGLSAGLVYHGTNNQNIFILNAVVCFLWLMASMGINFQQKRASN